MNTDKVYFDEDGNKCNIYQMVKRCPEWAANRIQVGEKAIESNKLYKALNDLIQGAVDPTISIEEKNKRVKAGEDALKKARGESN